MSSFEDQFNLDRQDMDPGLKSDLDHDLDLAGLDLSSSILDSVDTRRSFLPARVRKAVSTARFGMGAILIATVLAVGAIYNSNPEWVVWREHSAPLTNAVQHAGLEFADATGSAVGPLSATLTITTRALPHYIPSPHELAIASAGEGLSSLGAPCERDRCSVKRCDDVPYALCVTRRMPSDPSYHSRSIVLVLGANGSADEVSLSAEDVLDIERESRGYIP